MVPIAQEGVSYVSTSVNLTAVMEERVTDVKKDTSNLDENTSDAEEGRPWSDGRLLWRRGGHILLYDCASDEKLFRSNSEVIPEKRRRAKHPSPPQALVGKRTPAKGQLSRTDGLSG